MVGAPRKSNLEAIAGMLSQKHLRRPAHQRVVKIAQRAGGCRGYPFAKNTHRLNSPPVRVPERPFLPCKTARRASQAHDEFLELKLENSVGNQASHPLVYVTAQGTEAFNLLEDSGGASKDYNYRRPAGNKVPDWQGGLVFYKWAVKPGRDSS